MAKTQQSFGHFECNKVILPKQSLQMRESTYHKRGFFFTNARIFCYQMLVLKSTGLLF